MCSEHIKCSNIWQGGAFVLQCVQHDIAYIMIMCTFDL